MTDLLPTKDTPPTPTHPALQFLAVLDPRQDAVFNIETYEDKPKGDTDPKNTSLQRRWNGLTPQGVENILPELHELNDAGAGIFFAVNECHGPRSKSNVVRIRGSHGDFDNDGANSLKSAAQRLKPTIVVQSSPGKFQTYWLLESDQTMTVPEVEGVNRSLVAHHNADKAAVDASRLLRLPGFKHMKYREQGKTPIVGFRVLGDRLTTNQIKDAFPPAEKLAITQTSGASDLLQSTEVDIEHIAKLVKQAHPDLWLGWDALPKDVDRSQIDMRLACEIARITRVCNVSIDAMPHAIESVFNRSGLTREKWTGRSDYRASTIAEAIKRVADEPVPSLLDLNMGPAQESHGDVRNARTLAKLFRGRLMHVPERGKWMKWTDTGWIWCELGEEMAYAKEVAQWLITEAQSVIAQDSDRGKRMMAQAVTAHSLARLTAMLELAKSEPGMSVNVSALDADPMLLGVRNGVVDLRKGALLAHAPEMLITKQCNADYVRDSVCPMWLRFLDQIFEGDDATIDTIQRAAGYTSTGLNTEEKLFVCVGHGSNGKSVFGNVMHYILGGYSQVAPGTLLVARRSDDTSARSDIAGLAGCRNVGINELQAGDRMDEQVVKMLAGREAIAARYMYRDYFSFVPQFTPWLRTNHKPIVTGTDDGIWRRLVIVKFGRRFTDDEKDPFLEQKLMAERDGILAWMIDGARKYLQDGGLKLSPAIRQEGAKYRQESDILNEFLEDRTELDVNGRVSQQSLYRIWTDWCSAGGYRYNSKAAFTRRMTERGYAATKSHGERFYSGIRVRGLPCQ